MPPKFPRVDKVMIKLLKAGPQKFCTFSWPSFAQFFLHAQCMNEKSNFIQGTQNPHLPSTLIPSMIEQVPHLASDLIPLLGGQIPHFPSIFIPSKGGHFPHFPSSFIPSLAGQGPQLPLALIPSVGWQNPHLPLDRIPCPLSQPKKLKETLQMLLCKYSDRL